MAANRYDWTLIPLLREHVRREIHGYAKDELVEMLTDMIDVLDALEVEARALREREIQKRTTDAMESLLGRSKKGTGEN